MRPRGEWYHRPGSVAKPDRAAARTLGYSWRRVGGRPPDGQSPEERVPEVDDNDWYECDVCGRRRHASDRCGCGADADRPVAPAGWNPEPTAGGRPRLPLMGRPAPAQPTTPSE